MKSAPAKILEKHVTQQVKGYLQHRGWRPVRTQFAFSPGSFQTGEPGMADYLFLRYGETAGCGLSKAASLAMWIEFKGPNDKRGCQCAIGKQCKQCRQKAWRERERAMGGRVLVVTDFEDFAKWYEQAYGYLHSGDTGRGQLELIR